MFIVPARLLVSYAYASPASFAISASFATYAISAIPAASCWAIRWKGNQRHSFLKKKRRNISFIFLFPRKGRFRCQQMIHGKTGNTAGYRNHRIQKPTTFWFLLWSPERSRLLAGRTSREVQKRFWWEFVRQKAEYQLINILYRGIFVSWIETEVPLSYINKLHKKWTKMNQFFWIFT